jgi:hypothetical protein
MAPVRRNNDCFGGASLARPFAECLLAFLISATRTNDCAPVVAAHNAYAPGHAICATGRGRWFAQRANSSGSFARSSYGERACGHLTRIIHEGGETT